jgi:hypothetical protein
MERPKVVVHQCLLDLLRASQETKALFLEAQARWGLGQAQRAAELAALVLERDPAHAEAADLVAEVQSDRGQLEAKGSNL